LSSVAAFAQIKKWNLQNRLQLLQSSPPATPATMQATPAATVTPQSAPVNPNAGDFKFMKKEF